MDVVDQCWVAPIPVNAILNEQQMARIMYQWFYILVLYITVWGSVRLEERSVGVGARAITPREMYLAGSSRRKASYDSAVDVWAIGVNLFLMIAGYQKLGTFTRSTRVSDYLDVWAGIIGKVPAAVAARMGWAVESRVARGDGLQPAGRAAPLEPVAANRVGRSMPRAEISMCSLHKTILIYDPSQRPVAREVQRRCEDLTQGGPDALGCPDTLGHTRVTWLAASALLAAIGLQPARD